MTIGQRILRFLRVPPAPSAPAGDADVAIFRAAPKYLYYRILRWVMSNFGALVGLIIGLRFVSLMPSEGAVGLVFWGLEAFAIAGFVLQAVARLLLLRIDIDQRWYLVSDRSLRIREGIVNMKEKTMTFANIQNVRIEQGPLQRMFGIADVQVRTAGGGGGGSGSKEEDHSASKDMHIGYFRGVDNAAMIRDVIRDRLRRHTDTGLGDPDDAYVQPDSLMEAARALALEAGALRKAVTPRADIASARNTTSQ
jgi:membrane protein YdbS with pleckstrin-like domain